MSRREILGQDIPLMPYSGTKTWLAYLAGGRSSCHFPSDWRDLISILMNAWVILIMMNTINLIFWRTTSVNEWTSIFGMSMPQDGWLILQAISLITRARSNFFNRSSSKKESSGDFSIMRAENTISRTSWESLSVTDILKILFYGRTKRTSLIHVILKAVK